MRVFVAGGSGTVGIPLVRALGASVAIADAQLVLMTFSSQAPSFFERHGFEVLATIEEHRQRHRNC